ncbi:hypothetical protein FN846DRAFT_897928 [Sphaerosporella brunnea]|uniref:VWFA domain-containing protein n=1 Tax=Sphaerosporella brunnea TaxID=1250544 RepID=A0A5J5F2W2_9PEZI|nr:hypothetical protein FN846DRAFT_897928 [Sphaerosporella brunnea]
MPVERTSYLPYHPPSPTSPTSPTLPASDIHPALRPAALRPSSRARTVPSQSPLDRVAAAVEIGSSDSIPQVPRRKSTRKEDPYLLLRRFDTVIVVDDSLSMGEHWAATQSALETVATVALKHDQDGIDIHFMNHPEKSAWNVKSATHIRRLFSEVEPDGCTPTGECLDDILRDYLDRYAQTKLPASPSSAPDGEHRQPSKIKPLNIVVLTDGEPTDDPESVIVSAARRLEALNAPLHQVGIQFLQIGDRPDAREALEELDDHLADVYGIRDIVDTTQYGGGDGKEGITGEMLLKALLGGINRKWDRK